MSDAEVLLTGRVFQVVRKRLVSPDGKSRERQVIRHPGAVVVLPLLDDGRVVLIRNFRMAAEKYLVELPAGTLEPNEDPLAAAHRELAEETGYRAARMDRLAVFYSSPGILEERMFLYRATGLESGPTELQEDEEIETLPTAWAEAVAMARDGQIEDAKTLVGILWQEAFGRADERPSRGA
jgi:ADP-ribose pyrophosphatase